MTSEQNAQSILLRAVARLLKPLVRLLIASGVTYPVLSRLLKTLYVNVADKHFYLDGKAQTDSRISLITGVHRKDVKRLRHENRADDHMPPSVSLGSQLVARWLGDPAYCDENGNPLELDRFHRDDGEPSFEQLVSEVSKDIRPRAVLDEWLRLGVVSLGEDGKVRLSHDAFAPEEGYEEKVWYLGNNLQAHIATAVFNVLAEGEPRLERSVHYDGLTKESVRAIRARAHKEAMRALKNVNQLAMTRQKADAQSSSANKRIVFGAYFHEEEKPLEPDD